MTPNTHHRQAQLAFSENLTAVVVALTVALSVTFSAAANAKMPLERTNKIGVAAIPRDDHDAILNTGE